MEFIDFMMQHFLPGVTLNRAHPTISHCSHLQLKVYSDYKYKSLAKSTRKVVKRLHYLRKSVF